ncbi:MAG: DUF4197 domain-containing protein [Marinobacterium sp.]|nr:DUF4197 domain-containing protein [Marinobacterium sp.]
MHTPEMDRKTTRTLTIAALVLSLSLPAQASWTNLVDDAKKTGGELLKQQLEADQTLDETTLDRGLKEILKLGSERAVQQVSQSGAFMNNDQLRISLPESLQQLRPLLQTSGAGDPVASLEASINTAAEQAMPQLLPVVKNAISQLSFEDAHKIYDGLGDEATRYLQNQASGELLAALTPVIGQNLAGGNLTQLLANLPSTGLPSDSDINSEALTSHVANQALDGLFNAMAQEERQIRENPAARASELLQKLW